VLQVNKNIVLIIVKLRQLKLSKIRVALNPTPSPLLFAERVILTITKAEVANQASICTLNLKLKIGLPPTSCIAAWENCFVLKDGHFTSDWSFLLDHRYTMKTVQSSEFNSVLN